MSALETRELFEIFRLFRDEFLIANRQNPRTMEDDLGLLFFWDSDVHLSKSEEIELECDRDETYFVETTIGFSQSAFIFKQKIYLKGMMGFPLASCTSNIALRSVNGKPARMTNELKFMF